METTNGQGSGSAAALSEMLAAAVEKVGASVVAVDARPRVRTSGVIWREGLVVSTNHTVRRDEEITITLHDGREEEATLVGRDPGTDLALLRFGGEQPAGAVRAAETTDAASLKVGHLALAVGRAHPEQGLSASLGIVGALGGKWRTWRGGELDRVIRPDVSVFVGFSGGPLADVEGRVIGINTTGLARGTGLTIPAATVERVVETLLRHGRVARPYLGVGMHPIALTEKLRERHGLRQASGLLILSVEEGAPADAAGVTIGDILIELGGALLADTDDVQAALAGLEVGAAVEAKILRGGEVKELKMTLGERPSRRR